MRASSGADCGLLVASSRGRLQGGSKLARDSYQGTNPTHEGSTLMTSLNPSQSLMPNTLGAGFQHIHLRSGNTNFAKKIFLKEGRKNKKHTKINNRDSACCLGDRALEAWFFLFIKGAVFISSLRTRSNAHGFHIVKAQGGLLISFFKIEKPQTFAFNFLATLAAFDF